MQLSGDPRGQLPHTQRVGETLDLARRKGRKPDGRSRPSTRHPVESLRKPGDALAALRENGEHTLPDEAADHEQQRPEGVDVGPVRVVDHDSDGRLLLTVLEHLEDPGADPDRLLGGQRSVPARQQPRVADAGHPHQLVHHAVGEERLPLLTRGPQHRQVHLVGQEPVQHRRLPDPRGALEQDQARTARTCRCQLSVQRRDLHLPPDEGASVPGRSHCAPPRHGGRHRALEHARRR